MLTEYILKEITKYKSALAFSGFRGNHQINTAIYLQNKNKKACNVLQHSTL